MESANKSDWAVVKSLGDSSNKIHQHIVSYFLNEGLPCLKKEDQQALTVLDIGQGKGKLLQLLLEAIPDLLVYGTDVFEHVSNEKLPWPFMLWDASQPYPLKLNSPSNPSSKEFPTKFAAVICSEVIEHLENPWQLLQTITNLLLPGGIGIITTPNLESYLSLMTFYWKGYHSAFGPRNFPDHKTPVSMGQLIQMLNYINPQIEILHKSFVPWGRIPGGQRHWQEILPFLKGKRWSDNYLLAFRK